MYILLQLYTVIFFGCFNCCFLTFFLSCFWSAACGLLEKNKCGLQLVLGFAKERECVWEREGISANWYWPNQSMANCFVLALCNAPLPVHVPRAAFTFDSFDIRQAIYPFPLGQLLIDARSQMPPFPSAYLTEVRQKLRLLVGHIDALRLCRWLWRLWLEAV